MLQQHANISSFCTGKVLVAYINPGTGLSSRRALGFSNVVANPPVAEQQKKQAFPPLAPGKCCWQYGNPGAGLFSCRVLNQANSCCRSTCSGANKSGVPPFVQGNGGHKFVDPGPSPSSCRKPRLSNEYSCRSIFSGANKSNTHSVWMGEMVVANLLILAPAFPLFEY